MNRWGAGWRLHGLLVLAIAGTVLTARLGWRSEEALWEAVRGPRVEDRVEALHVLACRVGTDFQDEDLVDMLAADETLVRELALLPPLLRHGDRAAREAMITSLESASARRRARFLLTDRFGSFDPLTLEELEAFLEDPGD